LEPADIAGDASAIPEFGAGPVRHPCLDRCLDFGFGGVGMFTPVTLGPHLHGHPKQIERDL
jgi:hypothetical protein